MSATATHQPLRKKPSFRDRLTVRLRPSISQLTQRASPASPQLQPEGQRQRSVYVPKHAASDFSRMTLPSRATPRAAPRYSYEEAPTLTESPTPSAAPAPGSIAREYEEEDPDFGARPKRHSPPLQTLVENESTLGDGASKRESEGAPEERPRSKRQTDRTGRNHHSYKLVSDPWDAPEILPPLPSAVSMKAQSTPVEDESPALLVSPRERGEVREQPPKASRTGPQTDYEKFLARAEAEDRAHREHLLRNLSQRSSAMPSTYGKIVFPTNGSDLHDGTQVGSMGRAGRGDSRRGPGHHPKRTSWTPSFGKHDEENELRGGGSPPPRPRESGEYNVRPRMTQDPQQRTLRRQSSIAKRIVDYVRPVRQPTDADEPAYHTASLTPTRKTFGRAPAVATVTEV